MKSPSEIASEIIQLGIGYAVGTKTFDDFEGSIIQAITAERQRQERLVEALEKMCVSHENLYKAHFGETSNPMDDCIRREAQQVLKEVK